jgi:pimeloyl-ACP methyl ester carboxylesterase
VGPSIAGAQTVIVEGCGHFTFVERPERFREELTRFPA